MAVLGHKKINVIHGSSFLVNICPCMISINIWKAQPLLFPKCYLFFLEFKFPLIIVGFIVLIVFTVLKFVLRKYTYI